MLLGALNWTTGEAVAVKQIQLSSIPKAELAEIMVGFPSFRFFSCVDGNGAVRDRSLKESECRYPIFP